MNRDLTILIADDDPELRAYLRRTLERSPRVARVLEAGDGEGAWDLARSRRLHAVVTDLHLPRLDGFALCCRIDAAAPELPVLIVTGETARLVQARDYAATRPLRAVLAKPFNARTLLDAMDRLLAVADGSGSPAEAGPEGASS